MDQDSPLSVAQVSDLYEREDGFWEFRGDTLERHVEVFRKIDSRVNSAQWAMAAIAFSVSRKYKDSGVEKFAEQVEYSPRHIWRLIRTYKTFENCHRCQNLTFRHHTAAAAYTDPEEALAVAEARGMSSLGLEEWVAEQAAHSEEKADKAAKKAHKATRSDFLTHLEKVCSIIQNEFIAKCPNQDYARRVYRSWIEEVSFQIREINQTEERSLVRSAVEEGARTASDIKSMTGLPLRSIEAVVGTLVTEGIFEWVREGGETDVARGTRRTIIHIVGESVFV